MSFNSLSDLRKARGNFDSLMKEVEKLDSVVQVKSLNFNII